MSRLLDFLGEHPRGVTPAEVAREILKLAGPAGTILGLAESALRDVGATPDKEGRWRLVDRPTIRHVAVAGVCTGPYPGLDQLLDVAAVEVEATGPAREFASLVRPVSLPHARARDLLGPHAPALSSAPGLAEVRPVLDPLIRGARLIGMGDTDTATASYLSRLPGIEAGAGPLKLGRVLRRLGHIGRGDSLALSAERFDHPLPANPEPIDRARATAAIFAACLEREIPVDAPLPPPEAFDFTGMEVDRDLLAELPARPGIYRFYDRDGELLYLGKTKDLRRRVSGYFAHRGRRRRLYADMMERLHRLDWEETGSEIKALLLEMHLIGIHTPPFNVQRVVHRRRALPRDAVIFLPGREDGEVEILMLREGAPVGSVSSDRRARGMREVRRALRRAYFSPAPAEPEKAALAITSTWLRGAEDSVNLIDIDDAAGIDDAARRIRSALTDPELFEGKRYYR